MPMLHFEPIIFRDWTIIYCEIAWQMYVREFARQFNWHYSDGLFVWDRKKVTLYKAKEEHMDGMFRLIVRNLKKDKNFIKKIARKLVKIMGKLDEFLQKIQRTDLRSLNRQQFLKLFNLFFKKTAEVGPRFLLIMYFPQHLETYPEFLEKYQRENDLAIKTRAKVDKILGPVADKVARQFAEEFLKRLKIPNNFAQFVSSKDIHSKIDKGVSERLKTELQKRKNYFLVGGGRINYIPLEQYLEKKGWGLVQAAQETKLLKGTVAFKSNKPIKGQVKIVENKKEFKKIKKGDIIVAPMTSPEYLTVLKKVKAIITDEGGITCHAAIAARELGIPCVIGTKVATKVLKDGQTVELDTNRGVVKIIK